VVRKRRWHGRIPAALAALVAAVAGCEPQVRWDWWQPPPPSHDVGKARIDARTALRQAADAPNAVTRAHAIEGLAQIAGARAGGVYLQALEDPNPTARFAAGMAVGDARYAPAEEKLLRMAEDKQAEPDRRVFCAVLYALHRLGNDSYTPALGELLFDPEAEVRASAALAMGKLGEPSAVGPLKAMLSDEQEEMVKLQTRESLAVLGDARSQHLLEAFTKSYFLDLRLASISALLRTGAPRAQVVLKQMLARDKSPRAKVAAAGALAKLGHIDDDAYALCLRAAESPRQVLREAFGPGREIADIEAASLQQLAALALGRMRRQEAVGVLHPLLQSPEGSVRVAASISVLKLTGGMYEPEPPPPPPPPAVEPQATTAPAMELPPVRPKLHISGPKD